MATATVIMAGCLVNHTRKRSTARKCSKDGRDETLYSHRSAVLMLFSTNYMLPARKVAANYQMQRDKETDEWLRLFERTEDPNWMRMTDGMDGQPRGPSSRTRYRTASTAIKKYVFPVALQRKIVRGRCVAHYCWRLSTFVVAIWIWSLLVVPIPSACCILPMLT